MKPGIHIRLPDGREGTVVYHGLDGYGIKWGRHTLTDEDIGFLILNAGGTICTLMNYWGISMLFNYEADPKVRDIIMPIGILGTLAFGIASPIWGGIATANYNEKIKQDRKTAYISIAPEINALKLELVIPF